MRQAWSHSGNQSRPKMNTDSGGSGSGSAPAPHERVSSRESSALAALSVLVILLYLIWRFIWQCRKHGTGSSNSTGGATVSPPTTLSARPPPPSCASQNATAAVYGAGEAARRTPRTATTATSPLSVLVVRVAAARFGAEKVDCAVCLAELGDGDGEDGATRFVPGCGHGFHAECIEAWFRVNSTCPLCRASVAVAAAAAGQGAGEAAQYDSSV